MVRRFLEDARVGLAERRLELPEDSLRVGAVRVKEPLERVERELLDGDDGKGARLFAGAVPAHAVGHEKQMSAFLAELRLRLRQCRLPDAHRLGEFGAEELIFIGRAHAALVGHAERLDRQRALINRRHGWIVGRHLPSRSTRSVCMCFSWRQSRSSRPQQTTRNPAPLRVAHDASLMQSSAGRFASCGRRSGSSRAGPAFPATLPAR